MFTGQKILCPTDYSEASLNALNVAVEWARHFAADLEVLHVLPERVPDLVDMTYGMPDLVFSEIERQSAAEAELADYANRHVPPDIKLTSKIRIGDFAHEILDEVRNQGTNLLILSTHGHGGWRHTALGSVAKSLIRNSPCTVLTLGPASQLETPVLGGSVHQKNKSCSSIAGAEEESTRLKTRTTIGKHP